jgi:hypothetical protein
MATRLIRVGVSEFGADLEEYLDSPGPVAVTRDGQTVGYYFPARKNGAETEYTALTRAVEQFANLLDEYGISEDEVVSEFNTRRHARD